MLVISLGLNCTLVILKHRSVLAGHFFPKCIYSVFIQYDIRALQSRNGCFSSTGNSLTIQNLHVVFIMRFVNNSALRYASTLYSPSISSVLCFFNYGKYMF